MESKVKSVVSAKVYITLSEEEARALHAITLYGFKNFTRVFFEYLGKAYLRPYISGLESLFESIRPIEFELRKIDKAREDFLKKE